MRPWVFAAQALESMQPLAATGSPRVSSAAEPARLLYACVQEMARRRTNPVLEVLGGTTSVEWDRRYPPELLRFGGARLRAYYHCHRAPGTRADEHGHFHVFVRSPRDPDTLERWTHVAALSMDGLGQPLGWQAVNHWVSGGLWRPATKTLTLLDRAEVHAGVLLIERWLVAMLRLFRAEIASLLRRRDSELARLAAPRATADIRADRALYILAAEPVDLLARLGSHLAAPREKQARRSAARRCTTGACGRGRSALRA